MQYMNADEEGQLYIGEVYLYSGAEKRIAAEGNIRSGKDLSLLLPVCIFLTKEREYYGLFVWI